MAPAGFLPGGKVGLLDKERGLSKFMCARRFYIWVGGGGGWGGGGGGRGRGGDGVSGGGGGGGGV